MVGNVSSSVVPPYAWRLPISAWSLSPDVLARLKEEPRIYELSWLMLFASFGIALLTGWFNESYAISVGVLDTDWAILSPLWRVAVVAAAGVSLHFVFRWVLLRFFSIGEGLSDALLLALTTLFFALNILLDLLLTVLDMALAFVATRQANPVEFYDSAGWYWIFGSIIVLNLPIARYVQMATTKSFARSYFATISVFLVWAILIMVVFFLVLFGVDIWTGEFWEAAS